MESLMEKISAQKIEKQKPFIDKFCKKYNISLIDVGITMEKGYFEPLYTFSDNLGGYTIEGIKNSLRTE